MTVGSGARLSLGPGQEEGIVVAESRQETIFLLPCASKSEQPGQLPALAKYLRACNIGVTQLFNNNEPCKHIEFGAAILLGQGQGPEPELGALPNHFPGKVREKVLRSVKLIGDR